MLVLYLLLATIVVTLFYVTTVYYKEKYQQRDPMLYEIRENLMLLSPKAATLRYFEDNKSYTINKQKVYLCLKDDQEAYYPMNMLMYVAIHELAHVLCNEIGHTPKFHSIFSDLLLRATELGIYDPDIPVIQNYCGYNKETFVLTFAK